MQIVGSWFFFLIIEKFYFVTSYLKFVIVTYAINLLISCFYFSRYEKSICLNIVYSIFLISKSRVTSIVNRISWRKILGWQWFTQFLPHLAMWWVVNCGKKKNCGFMWVYILTSHNSAHCEIWEKLY